MLHILLFILKIIGILLLSILGLILLILALVLLVPVRYRAGLRMRTIADYSADGKSVLAFWIDLSDGRL